MGGHLGLVAAGAPEAPEKRRDASGILGLELALGSVAGDNAVAKTLPFVEGFEPRNHRVARAEAVLDGVVPDGRSAPVGGRSSLTHWYEVRQAAGEMASMECHSRKLFGSFGSWGYVIILELQYCHEIRRINRPGDQRNRDHVLLLELLWMPGLVVGHPRTHGPRGASQRLNRYCINSLDLAGRE